MIDDTSNDDIIDERIRALAAGHFNAPEGEPPRQAMWEGISAARRAARAAGAAPQQAVNAPDEHAPREIAITPLASRRSHAAAWRWGAALAAGLVLGIVVDRRIVRDPSTTAPTNVARTTPATPVTVDRHPSPDSLRATPESTIASPRRDVADRGVVPRRSPSSAGSPIERDVQRPLATRVPADSAAQALYRVAATQTLVQAEALLTSYRTNEGARDPQAMQQAARWARDVLSSTRLLIDSPAGRDPQMRALLSDLELILAQLVQLSGTPLQANERDLIERAIRERDLLPRLRSAVPAGLAAS
jgi:hypothetical protein